MNFSRLLLTKLGAIAPLLLLFACSSTTPQSSLPTPPPPLPVETATPSPRAITARPSPKSTAAVGANPSGSGNGQPTPSVDTLPRGIDIATSASALARDAQTPEDWKLVITQWQRAIASLKAVPKTSPDHKAAQKLLPTYQQQLATAQQRAKNNPQQTSTVAKGKPQEGGIPLFASANGSAAAESAIATLNQQQSTFFNQQKRFATNLTELGKPVTTDTPSYTLSTSGDETRSVSTAIAQRDGLPSYTGAVYILKEGDKNVPLSIVCASQQNSKTAPATPTLSGNQLTCPSGSAPV